ncbi:MAG: pilus assembly PilX family protein, partial [Miltoncostaeaceae bacterium]
MERTRQNKHEQGAALIVTVMLLVLMGLIGIAAMETVTQDRKVAGFQTQSKMALYAAEAGLSDAKERLTTDPNAYDKTAVVPFPACAAAVNYGDPAIYG